MKILSWNCYELRNARTVRALKKLIQSKDPNLVFLMETKRKDVEMNRFRNRGNLSNIVSVSCIAWGKERVGGLACLWKTL